MKIRFPCLLATLAAASAFGGVQAERHLLAHPLAAGMDVFSAGRENVLVSNGQLRVTTGKKLECYSYPGAWPIPGPVKVRIAFAGAFSGRAVLELWKTGESKPRRFEASAGTGGIVFETGLETKDEWHFGSLQLVPAKAAAPVDVTIGEMRAVYEGRKADALDFDVETGDPLHVVFAEDSGKEHGVAFFEIGNRAVSESVKVSGKVVMRDFFANGVEQAFGCTIEPGKVTRVPVKIPRGKGVWKVTAKLSADDGSECERLARFAILDRNVVGSRLAPGRFRMGINYHILRVLRTETYLRNTLHALDLSGAKLARIEHTFASMAKDGPDAINWSRMDRMVSLLKEHGLGIDAIIWGCPKWALDVESLTPEQLRHHRVGIMPARRGIFRGFCEALARRYGTDIDYYEMGNEPDLKSTIVFDPAKYVERIYLEGYEGVKAACPAAKVIPGGFTKCGLDDGRDAGRVRGQRDFIGDVLKLAGSRVDAVPFHQHGGYASCRTDVGERLLPYLASRSIAKPWYMNEAGLSVVRGNEASAARTVWRKILWCWANGSTDYIWYNLRATGWDPSHSEQGFGLIGADFRPRDGFASFAALSRLVSGLDFGEKLFEDDRRFAARFGGEKNGHRRIVVAGWDDASTEPVSIPFETDAKSAWRVDLMGNRKPLSLVDGRGKWEIAEAPSAVLVEDASRLDVDRKALADFNSAVEPVVHPCEENGWIPPEFRLCRHEQVCELFTGLPQYCHRLWRGTNDLSATVWMHPWKDSIRLIVRVRDDIHCQKFDGTSVYKGDSVMMGLRIPDTGKEWEFGFALPTSGVPQVVFWKTPFGVSPLAAAEQIPLTVTRKGDVTSYVAYLPYRYLGLEKPVRSRGFRFNVLVNDDDGDGVDGWIEAKPGINGDKNSLRYPLVRMK